MERCVYRRPVLHDLALHTDLRHQNLPLHLLVRHRDQPCNTPIRHPSKLSHLSTDHLQFRQNCSQWNMWGSGEL